jgi:hypothetical protein
MTHGEQAASDGATGIEVRVEHSSVMLTLAKALHAAHLDAILALGIKITTMVLVLDETEHDYPSPGPYVLQCEPGSHTLGVWFYGFGPFARGNEAYSRADLPVEVKPGQLTRVIYQIHSSPTNPPSLILAPPA